MELQIVPQISHTLSSQNYEPINQQVDLFQLL
jgi:hypothetical protein